VIRCQQRNLPALILQVAGKAKARPGEDVRIDGDIILGSSLWKILPVNFSMPELNADFLPRADPIVGLDQLALCCAPDPGTDQLATTGVSVHVLTVAIEARRAEAPSGWAGISALEPQVEFVYFGHFGEIKAALPDRFGSFIDRRNLIFGKALAIQA
jgi:hypothetical protein